MVGSEPKEQEQSPFRCLFNQKVRASETDLNGTTAYINSSLKYTNRLQINWFGSQGNYKVFPNNRGQTQKGWNHTSPYLRLEKSGFIFMN